MTSGSLFSGIGGFDLGLERSGMVCEWQVEIDQKCRDVLAYHWPDVERYEDVRDVGRRNLEPVDIITGGFPCQDVSVAGKREGLAGERSGLWFEFHRILEELTPRWVVVENVPGLLSSNGGRDFAVILQGLVEIGYGVSWRVLDAQYFGVAQRRRRVFIVGSLGDGRAAEVLFESESGAWDTPPSREKRQRVAQEVATSTGRCGNGHQATRDGIRTGKGCGDSERMECRNIIPVASCPQVAYPLTTRPGQRREPTSGTFVVAGHCTGPGWWNQADIAGTLRAKGENRPSRPSNIIAFDWQSGGDVRLNISDRHTSALQASQVPAVQNRYGVRRLTPTEAERLQGFPDGWTAVNGQSDSARYRQLGNAVCVPVAEWIGRRIRNLNDGR